MDIQVQAIDKPTTVIEARSRFRILDLREVWEYRELLWMLTLRDVKVRYKHTVLGIAWAVVRPALTLLIFSVVFGRFAKVPSDGIPYPAFVFAGLLPWMYCAQAIGGASASVVGASSLITRVYFPRLIVPLASIGLALIDFLVALVLLLPMLRWFGVSPGIGVLLVPFMVLVAVVVSLGIGILLAAITVTYRDFRHIEPFLMQIWMFATPVVYPTSLIPAQWRPYAYLNPMTGIVDGFRGLWLGTPIDWMGVGVSMLVGWVMLMLGVLYFERVERNFADLI